MDDKAAVFSNVYYFQMQRPYSGSFRPNSKIWDPSQSQECYTILSEALRFAQKGKYNQPSLDFNSVCGMATKLSETANISMMTLCCMLLGHPQWHICPPPAREMVHWYLFELTKITCGDSEALRDVFLALGDSGVAQQVAWVLSHPGTSTLGYIRHSEMFQHVLAQSAFFYIHTNQSSIEYELPLGREQLEQDIAIEPVYSGVQLPVSEDIQKFQQWWPGPINPNGALAFNFELQRPNSSSGASQTIPDGLPGLHKFCLGQKGNPSVLILVETGQDPLLAELCGFQLIDENGEANAHIAEHMGYPGQNINEWLSIDRPIEEEIMTDDWVMDDFDGPIATSRVAGSGKRYIYPAIKWEQLNLLSRARKRQREVPEDWTRLNSIAGNDSRYVSFPVDWERVKSAARSGKRYIYDEIDWDRLESAAASGVAAVRTGVAVVGMGAVGYYVISLSIPIGMAVLPYATNLAAYGGVGILLLGTPNEKEEQRRR